MYILSDVGSITCNFPSANETYHYAGGEAAGVLQPGDLPSNQVSDPSAPSSNPLAASPSPVTTTATSSINRGPDESTTEDVQDLATAEDSLPAARDANDVPTAEYPAVISAPAPPVATTGE